MEFPPRTRRVPQRAELGFAKSRGLGERHGRHPGLRRLGAIKSSRILYMAAAQKSGTKLAPWPMERLQPGDPSSLILSHTHMCCAR